MRLPQGYNRPDGTVPTGTEWEFERILEEHLEKVINKRIQEDPDSVAEEERKISWFEGSPFRGLLAFQLEHAAVFSAVTWRSGR